MKKVAMFVSCRVTAKSIGDAGSIALALGGAAGGSPAHAKKKATGAKDAKESKEPKEPKEPKATKESKESKEGKEASGATAKDPKPTKEPGREDTKKK